MSFFLEYYGSAICVSNDNNKITKFSSSMVNRIHLYTVENCWNRILKFLLASIVGCMQCAHYAMY